MPHQETVQGQSSTAAIADQDSRPQPQQQNFDDQPGVPAAITDDELWNKHEQLANKFKEPLKKLFPVIQKIHETRQVRNTEHFFRQLRDASSILDLKRNNPKPPTLTLELLGRVEQFLDKVVQVYTKYLMISARSSKVEPGRRLQIYKLIADINGVNSSEGDQEQQVEIRQLFADLHIGS